MKEVCGVWLTCLLLLGGKPTGSIVDENIESKSDPYHANVTSVSLSIAEKEKEFLSHVPLYC